METTTFMEAQRTPTVYFIDDSATMREVMKIAFRRENIGVVTCQDAATALVEIEQTNPDLVISDVVMPGKDGFEVCQFIKQHPLLQMTPVVLLSGVVNRDVADKAVSVKADELIRKPFQPQDLIARVRQLLASKGAIAAPPPPPPSEIRPKAEILSGIFGATPPVLRPVSLPPVASPAMSAAHRNSHAVAVAVAPAPASIPAPRHHVSDVGKLRLEIVRLENLVKKLQSELVAERDYARALEAHVKTLHDSD